MRAVNFIAVGAVLLLALGAALWVIALGGGGPSVDSSLSLSDLTSETETLAYNPAPLRLRFAVAAVLSPRATLENYEALAAYLGDRLGRRSELVQGKSYAEINALVRSGDVSVALVCSGAYVAGRSEFGMEMIAAPVVNGEATYRSYLIVHRDSPAQTWQDLRNRTFAFTDPLSNSGRLVPVFTLSQMGETPEAFFSDFIFTYAHDKSIQAVADGLVDAAAVDSLVYDFMVEQKDPIAERTRIIWRSPAYGINPLVVHPDVDPALRRQMEAILFGMDEDPEGRAVLDKLGIDYFTDPDPRAYDSIEAMKSVTALR